jgi:hypothetical protein
LPEPGWVFTSWQGDVASTANPLLVTMNGDLNLVVQFSQAPVSACGIGPELAALIPALGWLYRRRRRA